MDFDLPLGSSVAVWWRRATVMEPVAPKVPVEGSYSSALAKGLKRESAPPVIKTLPSESGTALWNARATPMEPVVLKVPGVCAMATDSGPPRARSTANKITLACEMVANGVSRFIETP